MTVEALTRTLTRSALVKHNGDVAAVAEELGVSKGTIYRWIKEWGLTPESLVCLELRLARYREVSDLSAENERLRQLPKHSPKLFLQAVR